MSVQMNCWSLALLSLSALVAGCGDTGGNGAAFGSGPSLATDGTTGEGSSSATTSTRVDAGDTGTNPNPGGDQMCPCGDALEDGIYVTNAQGELWFFKPDLGTFELLGVPACSSGLLTTNSMAVSRDGFVWYNKYNSGMDPGPGKLMRANLADLSDCQDVGYDPALPPFAYMGMGFASDSELSNCDDLYLYNFDTFDGRPVDPEDVTVAALGVFDQWSSSVSEIGPGKYPTVELTGTNEGRLFGFARTDDHNDPTMLIEFDKASGASISETLFEELDGTRAWAFAFWGGDAYLFTEYDDDETVSKVSKYDHDGNEGGQMVIEHLIAPIRITGAGVSTCATSAPVG